MSQSAENGVAADRFRVRLQSCGHTFTTIRYEHRRASNGWPEIRCEVCGGWSEGHTITSVIPPAKTRPDGAA